MSRPDAVLLDVGGIFLLPERARIVAAFERASRTVAPACLDDAHYRAAAAFSTDLDAEGDWAACWRRYLDAYVAAVGIIDGDLEEVHRHLDSEFADAALWIEEAAGARDGLVALAATGVALGVVSNADGLIGGRLREREILQVGPGVGVEVACVIDSGEVGVMKPDPRIFRLALDAMGVAPERAWYIGDMPGIDVVGARRAGLVPFLMDPLGLHDDPGQGFTAVRSLADLAARVDA